MTFWLAWQLLENALLCGEKFQFFGLIILLRVIIQIFSTKEVTFRNFV